MIVWGGSGRTDGAITAPARPAVSRGRAIPVPGLAALSKNPDAWPWSVSCGSAGNCGRRDLHR
jgi:hypothetical protein